MKLWVKILIALGLGLCAGFIIGPPAENLKPIGTIFINLISMVIVPLVLSSIVVGVCSMNDPKKLGRVGLRSMLFYFATTIISILVGIGFAYAFTPGSGLMLVAEFQVAAPATPTLSKIALSIIPSNPVAALVSGNVLQIIVFAVFLGLAINLAGEKGRKIREGFESLSEVMYKMVAIVMEFSPFGVFAIMAWVSGVFGVNVLIELGKFLVVFYSACLFHVALVFCGILWGFARLNPIPFFRGLKEAMVMAFSTGSSSATLPLMMRCANENLGVSKDMCNFILPFGTAINMNGTAIFQGMSAIFISQAYGIDLEFQTLVTIVVTATLSALGTAGVPGAGFIMLSAVLTSAGLPLEGLAILAGVDRLRDMVGTVLNILGDAVVAVTVAKQEGELDESCYYREEGIGALEQRIEV